MASSQLQSLQKLRRQLDVRTGGRSRAIGAAVLGGVWTVAPVLTPRVLARSADGGRTTSILFVCAMILAILTWAGISRKSLGESSVTRRLMGAALIAMFVQLALELVAWRMGIDAQEVQVIWPLLWFTVSAMLVVTVDWRLWPMTTGFLGALGASVLWPDLRFWAMGASNLVMTINMFSIWMPTPGSDGA